MHKKSSQELLHQIGQYLAWSIPRTEKFNLFKWRPWGHKWSHLRGL